MKRVRHAEPPDLGPAGIPKQHALAANWLVPPSGGETNVTDRLLLRSALGPGNAPGPDRPGPLRLGEAGRGGGDRFIPGAARIEELCRLGKKLCIDLDTLGHGKLTVAVAIAAIPS